MLDLYKEPEALVGRAVTYDPEVIGRMCARLYRRADAMVVVNTLVWAIIGLMVGAVMEVWWGGYLLWVLLGVLVGGYAGWLLGEARALGLRVQAQLLVVLVRVEANTRHA